ncbi:MAG: gluconeogenesis factor YvcK family protein [Desulfobulbaceae bacterium]
MRSVAEPHSLHQCLDLLTRHELSPLDFLADGSMVEKMISLVLAGPPAGGSSLLAGLFRETLTRLREVDTRQLRVVTLGGGTGLSNIIGGDSRRPGWADDPFTGLKEIFPATTSIVCVTDDGGSTGELLKELPLIAMGDLRHVLVSSVQRDLLREAYGLDDAGARLSAAGLHGVFNHRFNRSPLSPEQMAAESGMDSASIPAALRDYLLALTGRLFSDNRLKRTLARPQCLGNLLLASAIFGCIDPELSCVELAADHAVLHQGTMLGLAEVAGRIGAAPGSVLPCSTTPAQLQFLYANGVLVTGEYKSGHARRSYPVDLAMVEFSRPPVLPEEVSRALREADIIVFAPGSLYSSIIPILQVPGLAGQIRANTQALKILVANIWVQKGETDAARDAPERKFHVSDLVRAYNRNIPGGVRGLFSHILSLGLGEIPGSILQSYALEDKEPIYLDRQPLRGIGFEPVEADIFSADLLRRRRVVQHDPTAVARAVRTLWCLRDLEPPAGKQVRRVSLAPVAVAQSLPREEFCHPCKRFQAIRDWLAGLPIMMADNGSMTRQRLEGERSKRLRAGMEDILWRHPDILIAHLRFVRGMVLVDPKHWSRCQEWDNVFSFYAPEDSMLVIRADQADHPARLEMAFLVALGQSLLGDYVAHKCMNDISAGGERVGRIFQLTLRDPRDRICFFEPPELDTYLRLARMRRAERNPLVYTRLVNSEEGFTPPGLLFGLFYTWYLDNRYASHIEYKMSIMRNTVSDLIPEQVRIVGRREGLIDFFRETVFRHRRSLLESRL